MTHRPQHCSPRRAGAAGAVGALAGVWLCCALALSVAPAVAADAPAAPAASAANTAANTAAKTAATTASANTVSAPAAAPAATDAAKAGPAGAAAMATATATPAASATSGTSATPAIPATPLPRALTPVAAPVAADTGSSPTAGLLTMVVGLGIVLAVMLGIAWLLKRSGVARMTGNAAARVIGGVSVGTRERVVVVEVADQWIVIGVAPGRVNHLSTLPRADTDGLIDTPLAASHFSAWLKQTLEKRNANR